MLREKLRKWNTIIKNKKGLKGNKFIIMRNASIKASKDGLIQLGHVVLNENTFLCTTGEGKILIGDRVTVNRNSIIVSKKEIKIGEGTSIGPNVCIYDHDHIITAEGFLKNEFNSSLVSIGKNVWVGANVTILRGSTIGDNCVIGSGTVVKGTIAPNQIVYSKRELIIDPLR